MKNGTIQVRWMLALVGAFVLAACGDGVAAGQATKESLPDGIVLFGAATIDEPDVSTIQVISLTGEKIRTLHRSTPGTVNFGRISRQRDRLAFSTSSSDGKYE